MMYLYTITFLFSIFNFRIFGLSHLTSRRVYVALLVLLIIISVIKSIQIKNWSTKKSFAAVIVVFIPLFIISINSFAELQNISRSLLMMIISVSNVIVFLSIHSIYKPKFEIWYTSFGIVYWIFSTSILLEMGILSGGGFRSLRDMENGGLNYLFNHYVVLSIIYIWFLYLTKSKITYLVILLSAFLVISSLSRQNFIIYFIAISFLFYFYSQNKFTLVLLCGLPMSWFTYLQYEKFVFLARVITRFGAVIERGFSGRDQQLQFALELFASRPLLGHGFGGYQKAAQSVLPHSAPESSYNQAISEGGVFGAVFVIMFFVLAPIIIRSSLSRDIKIVCLIIWLTLAFLSIFNELLFDFLGVTFVATLVYFLRFKRR